MKTSPSGRPTTPRLAAAGLAVLVAESTPEGEQLPGAARVCTAIAGTHVVDVHQVRSDLEPHSPVRGAGHCDGGAAKTSLTGRPAAPGLTGAGVGVTGLGMPATGPVLDHEQPPSTGRRHAAVHAVNLPVGRLRVELGPHGLVRGVGCSVEAL